MRRFPLVITIAFFLLYCLPPSVDSQTLPSPTPPYILFIEPITVSSQLPTTSHFFSSDEERSWKSQGYVVRSHRENSTTLTILKTGLSFDVLTPDKPRINITEFSLSSPEQSPYQILLSLVKPLSSTQEKSLAPTVCNLSESNCTIHQAAKWDDLTVPGWGFSIKGSAAPPDFKDEKWYRSLAEDESSTILRTYGMEKKTSTQMTWKIQTNERTEGTYTAVVSLIALPY